MIVVKNYGTGENSHIRIQSALKKFFDSNNTENNKKEEKEKEIKPHADNLARSGVTSQEPE